MCAIDNDTHSKVAAFRLVVGKAETPLWQLNAPILEPSANDVMLHNRSKILLVESRLR